MALISCPDCGASVSDLSPYCKDCGRPIAADMPTRPAQMSGMSPFGKLFIKLWIGMAGVFVIVVGVVMFLFMAGSSESMPMTSSRPAATTVAAVKTGSASYAVPEADVGQRFDSLQDVIKQFERQGFLKIGRFEKSTWPASIVSMKDDTNKIQFNSKSGTPHTYNGFDGYRLKVVALEDEDGGETLVVFRSKEKINSAPASAAH